MASDSIEQSACTVNGKDADDSNGAVEPPSPGLTDATVTSSYERALDELGRLVKNPGGHRYGGVMWKHLTV